MEETHDNWKQFQGTELGGLLGQIYGNQNRPKINYPKPRASKSTEPRSGFIPGGAKPTNTDPRHATRRDVRIVVPKHTRHVAEEDSIKPVDLIAHRRSAEVIRAELDEIKMRQEHYRPANTKATSSDSEKERFRQICTFKGGKGLPEGYTLPVGEMPLELEAKKKERERIAAVRHRNGLGGGLQRAASAPLSVDEQMAEQLAAEVDSLRQHISEMQTLGMRPEEERRLRMQLTNRVSEMNRQQQQQR